jgi:threonylcarbamoyladenosine tRNA methylthiotransferase MtaB
MKFHIINLGCKVNKAESDTIAANLIAKGHQLVSLTDAQFIILNTCTVTGDAEKKTRKAARRALRENTTASLLVTGCAAVIDPAFYEALDARVRVVEKSTFASSESALRIGEEFPLRVSLKVQDGCDHACTYCIVHIARGKAWSRPADEIIAEAQKLESAGIREIMLSGIDLGSYRDGKEYLDGLLARLLKETSQTRFRISSIEPCSITEATIDRIANSDGRICRHLHIPLQSGSSKVLSEMNRPYSAEYYARLVEKLYTKIPELSLSTDIIVGFPGESAAEFKETIALAHAAHFSKIHGFRYSMRAGTPAAARNDQIEPAIKDKRLKILLETADELRRVDARSRLGKVEDILIESVGIGMSESYYKVEVPTDIEPGSLVALTLTGLDPSCIMKACKKN